MNIQKSIYISGPRMGTNNSIKGIESSQKKTKKKIKRIKKEKRRG